MTQATVLLYSKLKYKEVPIVIEKMILRFWQEYKLLKYMFWASPNSKILFEQNVCMYKKALSKRIGLPIYFIGSVGLNTYRI